MTQSEIGTAATGGRNDDGTEWQIRDAGEWQIVARTHTDHSSWTVHLRAGGEGAPEMDVCPGTWLHQATAELVAEAVAVAVRHVLQPAVDPAVAVSVEEVPGGSSFDRRPDFIKEEGGYADGD